SLSPSDRNQTRGGTQEKVFHHLHRDLQIICRGRVRVRRVHCAPWKIPLHSPQPPRAPHRIFDIPTPRDALDTRDEATRRCPPPSHDHITSRGSKGNEEQAESQLISYVFENVLHKWYESPLPTRDRRRVFVEPIYPIDSRHYGRGGKIVRAGRRIT